MSLNHAHPASGRLRVALLLTLGVLGVEVVAGLLSHSLALLSDAGHLVTDLAALGLAWFAVEQSRRPADSRRTFGYHRVGMLAALANSVVLLAVVAVIAYEAVRRLASPPHDNGWLVLGAAFVAVCVNAYIGVGLRHAGKELTLRSAFLHVVGDLLAAAAVLAGGAVIVLTGWTYVDPILSIAIAALITWGAVRIVLETVNILLEGMPPGLHPELVTAAIESVPTVQSVHDLHVWSLSTEQLALSCHVVVDEQSLADAEHLVRDLEASLCDRFGIGHTTIQLEYCHPCSEETLHGPGDHNHPHPLAASAG